MAADYARFVEALKTGGPAQARWVCRPGRSIGTVGLLPGSFNPPTDAHVALARSARENGIGRCVYVLSANTINKAVVTGIPLVDRLRLLAEIASADGDGVILTNRGLYVEIAEDVKPLIDGIPTFVVGYDKIVQIFDRRYYLARPAALEELFRMARIAVAPRDDSDEAVLAALIAEPDNRPYASRVMNLPLASHFRAISSTNIRAGAKSTVPPNVAAYLAQTRPFST